MKGNSYVPFMKRKGDGSTLNLDFMGGYLDSRVVLTRSANTATYINSSGYVTTAVANEARFEYDPTTLAAKGLLIEGAATNLLFYSEAFNTDTWWITNLSGVTYARSTISANSIASPNGLNTADTFLEIASTTGTHRCISSTITKTSGQIFTMSLFVKNKDRDFIGIRFADSGEGNGCNIGFNLINGTVGTGATFGTGYGTPTGTITTYQDGWYRITITASTDTALSFRIHLVLQDSINNQSYTSSSTALGIYIWGAQLETGTAASSYIPTTTGQATRNPDLALMTSTNFSSWFTGGTTGTFFVDWHGGVRGITSTVRSVISTDDLSTKHLHLQQVSAAGALKVADFGAVNSVSTANTITSGARTKGAFNFDGATTTVNLCLNGGTVATSSAIAFSVAPTWLVLGATSTTGTSLTDLTTVLNGSIRQIKYYPTALTSAQLIAMTT